MLKYVLLGGLNYQPMSGYDLKQFMANSTAHFWHANLSQVYVTLKGLQEEGLVTSTIHEQATRPDERIYTITESGRADLLAWLAEPITKIEPTKDTLLLKLFFAAAIDKSHVLTTLRLQRALHQQLQDIYRSDTPDLIQQSVDLNPAFKRDAVYWNITRRFGELAEDVYIQWLDETINLIEREL